MEAGTAPPPARVWSQNQLRSMTVMGLDENLGSVGHRPSFDPDLANRLRQTLEASLLPILDRYHFSESDPLVISKYDLGSVSRCEGFYQASLDKPFEWSIPKARGTVIHKSMQAGFTRRGAALPCPILVEQAVDRLQRDPDASISGWLQDRSDFEVEELIADVTECMVKLRADLPPIQSHWQPRAESRARVELCDRRCVLTGKFDLALGMPRGLEARTFLVDFKTGAIRYEHLDEMRFYGLLEAIRSKVPPWRTAVYYLDQGEWLHLEMTEDALNSATRRVIEGATKIARLFRHDTAPVLTPGPCSFCPALPSCEDGKKHLAESAGHDD